MNTETLLKENTDASFEYKGFSIEISLTAPKLYTVRDPKGKEVEMTEEKNIFEIKCTIDYLAERWEKQEEDPNDVEYYKGRGDRDTDEL
jgi:hypothetical protein